MAAVKGCPGVGVLVGLRQRPSSHGHSPHWSSAGFIPAREADSICCIPYALSQREVVRESAASLVTVVALNRE